MFTGGLCGILVVPSKIDAVLLYSFEVTTYLTGRRCYCTDLIIVSPYLWGYRLQPLWVWCARHD